MPTYDYHCPANGRTVEVSHKMADKVSNWGELCRKAGIALDGTSSRAKVEKLMGASGMVHSLGSKHERPCDTGPCGGGNGAGFGGGCGGGGCAF